MSGVSFLPVQRTHIPTGTNTKMLTRDIPKDVRTKCLTKIDWSLVSEYENEDNTAGSQTMACSGDVCEMVDLT